MAVLTVADLRKSYGALRAVEGVEFEIEAGEVFGLLGPNGAGKSTTINIIATLTPADGGDVRVDGVPVSSSAAYKRLLGYVPQEISLSERLTARENLTLIGRLYDLHGDGLRARVDEMLNAVGLADRARDLVQTFSGGMKRRLNIAGALLHDPKVVLMDEPTVGVDPQARAFIFEMVEQLAASGRSVLYTTHYMEEAERLCRRIAIIDHGRILAIGTLDELIRRVQARRLVVLSADGLTAEHGEAVARRMGQAAWNLEDGALHIGVESAGAGLVEAVRAAEEAGIRLKSVSLREPNLETVFLEMTGRALRD